MTSRRIDNSFRVLIAGGIGWLSLLLAAPLFNGFDTIVATVFIVGAVTLVGVVLVGFVILFYHRLSLGIRFTLFELMLLITWVAVFCSGESYLLSGAWGPRLRVIPLAEEFLLAFFAFCVSVLAPLACREHVRRKAAEAVRLKASESPFQVEAAQEPEDTVNPR